MEMIRMEHVSKSFGSLKVLDDVSLVCDFGKVYGLVGDNGAGKTTLFRCLTGMTSYEGMIRKGDWVTVGYLPADNFFYPLVTGYEYIAFCLRAYGKKVGRKQIDYLNANMFHLPLDRYASEYSTGMQKKLGFMAVYLQDPDLYILDEPFNGIDLKGCIRMKHLISYLKAQWKTVILSSHRLDVLHEVCDSIHYLREGRLLKGFACGSVEEIERFILNEEEGA